MTHGKVYVSLINYNLDVVNTYGRVVTETKTAFLHESGGPGCLLREVEERHNTVVACGNKFRTGKKSFWF